MAELRSLHLQANRLTGLPASLGNLSRLKQLVCLGHWDYPVRLELAVFREGGLSWAPKVAVFRKTISKLSLKNLNPS